MRAKARVDVLLVERGLAASRARAQALVMSGNVFTSERRIEKPGTEVAVDAPLTVREAERFVSRGGYKLEGALKAFACRVAEKVCADVGASTGGFTDCLLQHGARKVYAIDVGQGQLAQALRVDPRVTVMDRTNARHVARDSFAEPLDWVVVDASFISLEKLLPAIASWLLPRARLLAMIKPQFEVGREHARQSRGVIRDPALRAAAIDHVLTAIRAHGFSLLDGRDSELPGPKGNVEFFALAQRDEACPP